ncbi:MAG: hypothetical protein DSM106950_11815 [Stigonema ocellatum SAG 48.90 = DSM 106950]|nr:hypothetical protein [Stigonema ocellatum SAG 48.90 = DSM 106950]
MVKQISLNLDGDIKQVVNVNPVFAQMSRVGELSDSEIEAIMLAKPFEKFKRRKFVSRL